MKLALPFLLSFCLAVSAFAQGIVTFQVDMNEYTEAFTVAQVAGSFNSWGTDIVMADDDGDGVWTVDVPLVDGDYEFKYMLDAWNAQEELTPNSSCTVTNGGYTNRTLTVAGENVVFDVVCFASCEACGAGPAGGDVTLQVDMSEYTESFTTVYISGAFNSWCGDCNPMTDMGNGIWEGTVTMPGGANEYKFTIDNWAVQEEFMGGEPCTVTNSGYTNRVVDVDGDGAVAAVCWNSCDACGVVVDMVNITFNVNTELIDVDPAGIFIAGGATFGVPGDNPLSDDDGDGIWTITVQRPVGFTGFYAFANGNCPDFSCKENLAGQTCAANEFNDRQIVNVTEDITINTCYEQCSDDGTCADNSPVSVTLRVNMAEVDAISPDGVFVGGAFESWSGSTQMSDDDGDMIYEFTTEWVPGNYEFLFINGAGFSEPESFDPGGDCTLTTGEFTNRLVVVEAGSDPIVTEAFCFNSCETCISDNVNDITVDHNLFELVPNITAGDAVVARFSNNGLQQGEKTLTIFNPQGVLIQQVQVDGLAETQELNTADLPQGLYLVQLRMGNTIGTQRLIIQK
jgi:hypothetical protein